MRIEEERSPPQEATGDSIGPPGESLLRAVKISHPVAVTSRVCSRRGIRHAIHICCMGADKHTELCGPPTVDCCACTIVRPGNVPVFSKSDHGLNSEGHTGFALADSLVLRVMGDAGRAVKQSVDTMSAVRSHHREPFGGRMLVNDIAQIPEEGSRFY